MTLDLSHLSTPTRELAFQDAKARIKLLQTARWVAFPRAGIAVEELERRFHYPTRARMPCMLLYGDSGMGKTMILEKMERQHPKSYDERRGITKRPVLIIQMPASPDERRFYTRILDVLERPTPFVSKWPPWRVGSSICCRRWGRSYCSSTRFTIYWPGASVNSAGRSTC